MLCSNRRKSESKRNNNYLIINRISKEIMTILHVTTLILISTVSHIQIFYCKIVFRKYTFGEVYMLK